eukprot:m.44431 g.44431  ORF g.44431 m.44431 type:complete len:793 (-) comp10094_c0_seq2:97-2475(-)
MEATKKGWLHKVGGKRKTWKKRFFVLNSEGIIYYTNEKEKQAKGTIPFSSTSSVLEEPGTGSYGKNQRRHVFLVSTTSRVYRIQATSDEEMNDWIENIQTALRASDNKEGEQESASMMTPSVVIESDSDSDGGTTCMDENIPTQEVNVDSEKLLVTDSVIQKLLDDQVQLNEEYESLMKEKRISSKMLDDAFEECVDAIGVLECSIRTSKRQEKEVEAKAAYAYQHKEWLLELQEEIKSRRVALKQAIALFHKWGLYELKDKVADMRNVSTNGNLGDLSSAANGNDTTLQRVVGWCALSLDELLARKDKGDAPSENEIVLAQEQLQRSIDQYEKSRIVLTKKIVPQILKDIEVYEQLAKDQITQHPQALQYLEQLEHTTATKEAMDSLKQQQKVPFESTSLEYIVYSRQAAGKTSVELCSILSKVLQKISAKVTISPGSVKKVRRIIFKSLIKYGGNFSNCCDMARATLKVANLEDVAKVVETLLVAEPLTVLRVKNRFAAKYDAIPEGGYRDVQLLCTIPVSGIEHFVEIQVNLSSMSEVKSGKATGGGHNIFKTARAIEAFTPSTIAYNGVGSQDLWDRIAAGMLDSVNLSGHEKQLSEDDSLGLYTSLLNPLCRLRKLSLKGCLQELDDTSCAKLIQNLFTSSTIKHLDLSSNNLKGEAGNCIGEGLASNTTLEFLDIQQNNLDESVGQHVGNGLASNDTLRILEMNANSMGKAGVHIVQALSKNMQLQRLCIAMNQLSDECGAALVSVIKDNSTLQYLNLKSNFLSSSKTNLRLEWELSRRKKSSLLL